METRSKEKSANMHNNTKITKPVLTYCAICGRPFTNWQEHRCA